MLRKPASGVYGSIDLLLVVALVTIAVSTFAALRAAWHWPLVGDASLMRYVVFLLQNGHAPYSQIVDINLPGSYFVEASAMRILGGGAVGLRLYDGVLSAIICICAAMLSRAELRARVCALAGALLLVLIHLRDGLVQAGQRDYAILAIILLAYALMLRGPFATKPAGSWVFGFLLGCTMTIKPTMVLLVLLPLYVSFLQHERPHDTMKRVTGALAAFLLPLVAMFYWLHTWHAIPAFLSTMQLVRLSHSGIAHKRLGFLLGHSSEPVALLLVFGIVMLAFRRFKMDYESKLLLFGAVAGLGSFLLQGKGFSYQRYPFLGLIIVVIFGLVADEFEARPLNRTFAAAVLIVCCLWWAPKFALGVARYDRAQPFQDALASGLTALHAGSGDVQCLDTVGGCVNVLYNQRLVQSTGYLYDCYAYVGPAEERTAYRQSFLNAMQAAQPRYIVLTSEFCLDAKGSMTRIEQWPALRDYLSQDYVVVESWQSAQTLHWWHQPETPTTFEIFSRRKVNIPIHDN